MGLLIHGPQSLAPRPQRNKALAGHYRALFEPRDGPDATALSREVENAVAFLKHQRKHKVSGFLRVTWSVVLKGIIGITQELLERYNPLIDLTAEERIEATARRVGLNMPEMARGDSP